MPDSKPKKTLSSLNSRNISLLNETDKQKNDYSRA